MFIPNSPSDPAEHNGRPTSLSRAISWKTCHARHYPPPAVAVASKMFFMHRSEEQKATPMITEEARYPVPKRTKLMCISMRPISPAVPFALFPVRYSIRRLDYTHFQDIRLSDLRIRQGSPATCEENEIAAPADPKASNLTINMGGSPGGAADPASAHGIPAPGPSIITGIKDKSLHRAAVTGGGVRRGGAGASLSEVASPAAHDGVHVRDLHRQPEGDAWGVGRAGGAEGERGGGCFRFGSEEGTFPRVSPSPSCQPWSSNPQRCHLASAGSSLLLSRTSTITASVGGGRGSGGGRGAGGIVAAGRKERAAADAEARQALARAEPNLFPEIFVPPSGGSKGRRGWLPEGGGGRSSGSGDRSGLRRGA